jgi:hypothetical protein
MIIACNKLVLRWDNYQSYNRRIVSIGGAYDGDSGVAHYVKTFDFDNKNKGMFKLRRSCFSSVDSLGIRAILN